MSTFKKALIVGVGDYKDAPLPMCVDDAKKMHNILSLNYDQSLNFECKLLTTPEEEITRKLLTKHIEKLFSDPVDIALFYFSGHGHVNERGGFLVTQDMVRYEEGVAMDILLNQANRSPAREVFIIVDACYAGHIGNLSFLGSQHVFLREGLSILTSSTEVQTSLARQSGSVFTSLVYDALDGAAADIFGKVNVGNVYSFVDQALGAWDQRPLFKANVAQFRTLRNCRPKVDVSLIRRLPELFPKPDHLFKLDPSYEPDVEPRNEEHEEILKDFQKLRDLNLLVPEGEEHLYYAAINKKFCRLTKLGQYYWHLAKRRLI